MESGIGVGAAVASRGGVGADEFVCFLATYRNLAFRQLLALFLLPTRERCRRGNLFALLRT